VIYLGIWEIVLELARRFLPTPQDKQEFEKLVMQAKAQEEEAKAKEREQMAQEFIAIMQTTQPSPDRVYVWANTAIALVRPTVTLLIVGSLLFRPDRLVSLLEMASKYRDGFILLMAPVLWWFFGRDINKFLGRDGLGVLPRWTNGKNGSNGNQYDPYDEPNPPVPPLTPGRTVIPTVPNRAAGAPPQRGPAVPQPYPVIPPRGGREIES